MKKAETRSVPHGTRLAGSECNARHLELGKRGFTLLEVLAAVAVLGISFVVIANSAMLGLRAEGQSRRLLEASLLADSVISDFEASLVIGNAPEIAEDSYTKGDFSVDTKVTRFVALGIAKLSNKKGKGGNLRTLVGARLPGVAQHLRTISVQVSWAEGNGVHAVYRTSYALHVDKAAKTLWGSSGGTTPRSEEEIQAEIPTS